MQTQISAPAGSSAGTTPPAPSKRLRYTLLCDDGYLLACHGLCDHPITVVPRPELATSFVLWTTATQRAIALQKLGWQLKVVQFYLPTP